LHRSNNKTAMIKTIKKRMVEKDVSLAKLAVEVKMQHQVLKKYLDGETDTLSKNLFNICEFLELKLENKKNVKGKG